MNRDLRWCPGCDANVHVNIMTVSPAHFVPLNHSYCNDVLEVLGLDPHEQFPIVRCLLCGFQYSLYVLKPELLDKLYNECIDVTVSQSKIYKVYKRKEYLRVWSTLFNLWSAGKNDETLDLRLIDYGCGWGDFMLTAQMPGLTCVGLECDQRKASYVRALGFKIIDSLDGLDQLAPFDFFFCNQVLEHVPQPKMVIRRINSCLAVGAYGFVGVPNFGSQFMESVVNTFREGSLVTKNVNPLEHLNYFSPKSLIRMLEEAGFCVIMQSNQCESMRLFLSAARTFMSARKNWISEGITGLFRKTKTENPSCILNSTSLYVQKIREL